MSMINQFFSIMDKGGPIMWVILLAAAIAMIMLAWQSIQVLVQMRFAQQDYIKFQTEPRYVPMNNLKHSSPAQRILTAMNWREINSQDDIVREINIHMAGIVPRLEGVLPTVATLGSLLPMLGLLGTVTGMINVFEVIALHGTGNPEEMAHGISQALFTTAGGLIFAIPVIFFHHLLARKVNKLMMVTTQAMQIIMHRDLNIYKNALAP
ncbi:MAG: MotA/TolQ/ExbB proton channel family protein [Gammaproteobacteria bacterium]|jgi:biopolymer transport protein ExbB|nr:MotA/TolQ/ExbB proton channel family protein [Gammaproteobacteria bacterium]